MRILFFARHFSYIRNFESAVEELAVRGHHVHLVADREEAMGGREMVERLAAKHPNLTVGVSPNRAAGAWSDLARKIRLGLDYLRFLEPRYAATPYLGERARTRAPRSLVRLASAGPFATPRGRARVASMLRGFERGLPRGRELEAFMRAQAPDVVLITPLVDLGSPQLDHLATARALGLRTVLPVGSWDHLSSKALLRTFPDALLVWNQVQKAEAVEMHGAPPDRVAVTGAQAYDQWFDRAPSRSREAFCTRVGLRADRPFVTWLCSSLFRGTASEPAFVMRWIEALRGSGDPRLRDIGILVRPHPGRLDEWKGVDLTGYRNLALWGAHPVTQEAKDDYFDSMYYSAAVVGLNTSAFIESACVGKPAHTILLPEISTFNQEGTIHFHYLLEVNGGLLRVARGFDEHLALLAASLAGDGGGDDRAARFVDAFVRPFGRHEASTPRFVDALERLAAQPAPPPSGAGASSVLWRLPLLPLALALHLLTATQPWRKSARLALRKVWMDGRRRAFVELKGFAQRQLGEKETAPGPAAVSSALTPKPGRPRDPAKKLAGWNLPEAEAAREQLTRLGRSGRPVIVGPWLSETGFELLYWIPFLAWAKAYGNLDPDKLVVVSRGGAAAWYSGLTAHYEDIFSFYAPDEFRVRNEQRIVEQQGRLKHLEVATFDRDIVAKVTEKRGLHGAELLHPSVMYRLFEPFWFQRAPITLVEAFTSFSPVPRLDPGPLRGQLPPQYVAAKFYGNSALPDTPENRAFVAEYLRDLTRTVDVVLLNTGHRFDDHGDLPAEVRERLHPVEHLMTPETNLDVQTRIIQGAQAFVGTYGGFSYLAPLCGVDTLAFYSHVSGFRFDHLEVAKRIFSGPQHGAFVELDVRSAPLLRIGFGGRAPVPGLLEAVRR